MKQIARLNGSTVVNIEIADQEWIDAQPDPSIFVEFSNENLAFIGGDYVDGFFYPLQPFPSWVRSSGEWVAPIPRPDGVGYIWDEDKLMWVYIPKPDSDGQWVWDDTTQSWSR